MGPSHARRRGHDSAVACSLLRPTGAGAGPGSACAAWQPSAPLSAHEAPASHPGWDHSHARGAPSAGFPCGGWPRHHLQLSSGRGSCESAGGSSKEAEISRDGPVALGPLAGGWPCLQCHRGFSDRGHVLWSLKAETTAPVQLWSAPCRRPGEGGSSCVRSTMPCARGHHCPFRPAPTPTGRVVSPCPLSRQGLLLTTGLALGRWPAAPMPCDGRSNAGPARPAPRTSGTDPRWGGPGHSS